MDMNIGFWILWLITFVFFMKIIINFFVKWKKTITSGGTDEYNLKELEEIHNMIVHDSSSDNKSDKFQKNKQDPRPW